MSGVAPVAGDSACVKGTGCIPGKPSHMTELDRAGQNGTTRRRLSRRHAIGGVAALGIGWRLGTPTGDPALAGILVEPGIVPEESLRQPPTEQPLANGEAIDIRDFGAIGGATGTSIATAGADLAAIHAATGQDWLTAADSMDLAAFYLAQAAAEATGRTIHFPADDYIFTAPGFVHPRMRVDLGGSTVTNVRADSSRFVRSNRVFILGILAREDFDRFDAQGWTQWADGVARGDTTLANCTGPMPSVGDTLMIRTVTATSTPTLPEYTTWNEVAAVSGGTVTLAYPLEREMSTVAFVNFSAITTPKSWLAGNGEPHPYYCATGVRLANGTLISTDGPAFEVNAALDFEIDLRIHAPRGQAVYGNGWNRGRVRVAGVCGGPKGAIELAVGSALTTVEVDLRYSGEDDDSAGSVSGKYAHLQLGEHCEGCVVTGRLDMGDKPAMQGVTIPTGNRNLVDVEMVGHGITANAVVFASNSGTGNRVRGRYETGAGAEYFGRWSSGTGSDNWLEDATFSGSPRGGALRFQAANAGGARRVVAETGQLIFDPGATGNQVIDCDIPGGILGDALQGA